MANDPRFEVYPRRRQVAPFQYEPDGYGWRFRDANGQITFIGGEGFTRREDAKRALRGAVLDVLRSVLGQRIGIDVPQPPIIDVED